MYSHINKFWLQDKGAAWLCCRVWPSLNLSCPGFLFLCSIFQIRSNTFARESRQFHKRHRNSTGKSLIKKEEEDVKLTLKPFPISFHKCYLQEQLDEESFEDYRSGMIARLLEKDPSLLSETNDLWSQIVDKR